jgi:hypothetical protein
MGTIKMGTEVIKMGTEEFFLRKNSSVPIICVPII